MSDEINLSSLFLETEIMVGKKDPVVAAAKGPPEKCIVCFEELTADSEESLSFAFPCGKLICTGCAISYYKKAIDETRSVLSCPDCKLPDVIVDDKKDGFYVQLCTFLTNNLPGTYVKKLKQIIEDLRMQLDPNFGRCPKVDNFLYKKHIFEPYLIFAFPQCQGGFIKSTHNKMVACTHCQIKFCHYCEADWMDQHREISCTSFAKWKKDNFEANNLDTFFQDDNLLLTICPKCKRKVTIEV